MIKYNFEVFKELLQNIGTLANATTTFYDQAFVSSSVYHLSSKHLLCHEIKADYTPLCQKSDYCALKKAKDSEEPAFHYSCHFGLIEMCFRLGKKHTPLGYILIGPFRPKETTPDMLKQLKDLAELNGVAYDKVLGYYKKITKFSTEQFVALKQIIYQLFEYMELKNYIYEDKGYFTNTVEPFILNNLTQELSISYLCSSLFLTQKQLYKMFAKHTNGTPRQYVNRIRIIEAKKLIISTEKTISEISATVGFPDYNYFIKLFKAQEGVTPLNCRKTNKY